MTDTPKKKDKVFCFVSPGDLLITGKNLNAIVTRYRHLFDEVDVIFGRSAAGHRTNCVASVGLRSAARYGIEWRGWRSACEYNAIAELLEATRSGKHTPRTKLKMSTKPKPALPPMPNVHTSACIAEYRFRSPRGDIYEGKNIAHFVRTHRHLFEPKDVKFTRPGAACFSGAYHSLLALRSGRGTSNWKGWTVAEPQEEVERKVA